MLQEASPRSTARLMQPILCLMETPDQTLTTTRLGTAVRACCEAIATTRNWTREGVYWPDAGQAWVELVDAIDAFSGRARAAEEPPQRMLVELKAVLETLAPADASSEIRDVVISYAIEAYFNEDQ
jgi:hypothetical protein